MQIYQIPPQAQKNGSRLAALVLVGLLATCMLSTTACMNPSNAPTSQAPAEMPVSDPAGGSYPQAQLVKLSSATARAIIHYTLDGTDPTIANGQIYGAPIVVPSDATIKAIATITDAPASAILVAAYVIQGSAGATVTLPPSLSVKLAGVVSPLALGTTMTVSADCTESLVTYAWYLDAKLLAGETNPTVVIGKDVPADTHSIAVVVSEPGSKASAMSYFTIQ